MPRYTDTTPTARVAAVDRSTLPSMPTQPEARRAHLLAELAVLDAIPADATYPLKVTPIGPISIVNVRSADHRVEVR